MNSFSHIPNLTLGTRGSDLALVQATMPEKLFADAYPGLSVRREIIRTTGDGRTDVSLRDVAKAEARRLERLLGDARATGLLPRRT